MDTENKFQMDTHGGDAEMHTQINIPTNSESGILPQRGISNTFQKNKSKNLDRIIIDGKNGAVVFLAIKKDSLHLTGMQCCCL